MYLSFFLIWMASVFREEIRKNCWDASCILTLVHLNLRTWEEGSLVEIVMRNKLHF